MNDIEYMNIRNSFQGKYNLIDFLTALENGDAIIKRLEYCESKMTLPPEVRQFMELDISFICNNCIVSRIELAWGYTEAQEGFVEYGSRAGYVEAYQDSLDTHITNIKFYVNHIGIKCAKCDD